MKSGLDESVAETLIEQEVLLLVVSPAGVGLTCFDMKKLLKMLKMIVINEIIICILII